MHGCGNDYVYVNLMEEKIDDLPKASIKVSDRHFGIGSDGLITVDKSDIADCKMRIFNADGSEAQMCGNGIRCVAKFVYDKKIVDKKEINIESNAGIKKIIVNTENDLVVSAKVNMGSPNLDVKSLPVICDKDEMIDEPVMVDGKEYRLTCVSMGNPHAVTFVEDTDAIEIEKIGPKFEFNEIFPERVNTEFVQIINDEYVKMRVWERGSGETLACGTGACAVGMACILNGYTKDKLTVELLGGKLTIEYDRDENVVYMTGPATTVFEGEIEL